ncbi:uncharacterized protein LOC127706386 isoform X2 [Mytilus californianus]|nr:uncharacterized protein LOC127706386 isoform X2 [Mytilus californianus]
MSQPKIEKNGEDVLAVGTTRKLRCNVITPLNLQMYWKCLNTTSNPPTRYNTSLSIFAYIEAQSSDHGEICTCIVQFENFETSASIVLNISSPPIIQVRHSTVCNQTADAYLQCILSGDLQYYGFSQWTHTVNGKFIRKLNGRNHGNTSSLLIQSCSYEDVGNYTCRAWNENNHKKYWSNKTTILTVNDLPVITNTDTITNPELHFVVSYYSVPTPVYIEWFRYGEKLENSTLCSFSSIEQSVNLPIHGIKILCEGYRSNLSIVKPFYGEYIAVLKNSIGETKHYFKWESTDKSAFDFQKLLWGLTGVTIFIATAGIMGVFMKIRTAQGNQLDTNNHINTKAAAIYYAAPEEDNYVHVYNDTEHCYNQSMNSSAGQYEEIPENNIDISRREVHERHYDVSHQYSEIDT